MKYHTEERIYPDFAAEVKALPEVMDVDGMECPKCGGRLTHDGYSPDEQYTMEGWFESTERFCCYDCGTFADVTQRYEPTVRCVDFHQDIFDD